MSPRHLVSLLVFVLLGCGGGSSSTLQGKANSGFVADADGWLISGDAQSTSVKPDFSGTGGNPDGLISAKDDVTGGVWYFVAPAKYLGDNASIAGKALKFDLKVDKVPTNPFPDIDVKLIGGGVTLVFDTPNNPTEQWTSYTVPLTAADMTTVLKDTTALWIRGEFNEGPDTGSLDNVQWGVSN